jgi:hypothetical protein
MEPDAEPSTSIPPAESTEPIEPTAAELEELEALCRAHNRDVAMVAAARLLGPLLLIGLLVAIGAFSYIQVANFRARAREEMEKDPIRGMETIMRAAGRDAEADEIFSKTVDFEDVERQLRSMDVPKRKSN